MSKLTGFSFQISQQENAHLKNIDASVVVLTTISEGWKKYSTKLKPFDNLRVTLKNLRVKASTIKTLCCTLLQAPLLLLGTKLFIIAR